MSDPFMDMLKHTARTAIDCQMAGYRSRDNEVAHVRKLLEESQARNIRMLNALVELEEILEDRYDGPEDTHDGNLLAIVRRGLCA